MVDNIEQMEQKIVPMTLKTIEKLLKTEMKNMPPQVLKAILGKSRIAMMFWKECKVNERINNGHNIMIFRAISENKKEFKNYIKITMPKLAKVLK